MPERFKGPDLRPGDRNVSWVRIPLRAYVSTLMLKHRLIKTHKYKKNVGNLGNKMFDTDS